MENKKITRYVFSLSADKKELRLISHDFEIRPAIKYVRKEKKILKSKSIFARFKIDLPFTMVKVTRVRNWLGDGMQQDDINCSSETTESVKEYDPELFRDFVIEAFRIYDIEYDGSTKQHL